MIDEWRYDDGKMHERQICLICLVHHGEEITKEVYEFCHYFTSKDLFKDKLPDTKEKLQKKLTEASAGGDIFKYVTPLVLDEYKKWKELPK